MNSPQPFVYDIHHFKAFVLGADPSNFSDNGKTKEFTHAFGIGSGDPRYYRGILSNLKEINLGILDVYVRNLIPDYLTKVTAENENWESVAMEHLPKLKEELDTLDKSGKIPVLVTAERIMAFLIGADQLPKAGMIYSLQTPDVVFLKNALDRPLIPFYRHPAYNLKLEANANYRNKLKEYVEVKY